MIDIIGAVAAVAPGGRRMISIWILLGQKLTGNILRSRKLRG